MVKRHHLFNGKSGMRVLRLGGICVLCSFSLPSALAYSHSAVRAYNHAVHWQDEITVQGTVRDESNGQPLAGVTVTIKGTSQATTTNEQGVYSIDKVPASATLVFTSIGMEPREVDVASQTTIDVTMVIALGNIDEVVVLERFTEGDFFKSSPRTCDTAPVTVSFFCVP